MTRPSRLGGHLVLSVVATTAFLVAIEGLLWALGLPRGGLGTDAFGRNAVPAQLGGGLRRWAQEDPDLIWSLRPNQHLSAEMRQQVPWRLTTNARGFRGREIPAVLGRPAVLCVGDSVTMGFGMDDEWAYPVVLEERLRGRPGLRSAEVINLGVNGYSSEQGRLLHSRMGRELRPDVVVLSFGFNDGGPTVFEDATLVGQETLTHKVQLVLARLRLYAVLRKQIIHAKVSRAAAAGVIRARVPPERYRQNLRAMVREARANGGAPILLAPTTREENFHNAGHTEFHAAISVYRRVMAGVAHDEGLPFLDIPRLSGRCRDSGLYFIDVCHLNERGVCVLVEELAPLVEETLHGRTQAARGHQGL